MMTVPEEPREAEHSDAHPSGAQNDFPPSLSLKRCRFFSTTSLIDTSFTGGFQQEQALLPADDMKAMRLTMMRLLLLLLLSATLAQSFPSAGEKRSVPKQESSLLLKPHWPWP
ncbi:hypothetical protein Q1695_009545 [Nippostrongylus brasiliensis]|nr:hypothetical protein Q1695_009545 [Nippostrongylus brasiliensis]